MKILGIETSCDETAASVVEDGVKILSNVVVSQIDIFAEYGGVIPEVAARSHLEAMMPVIDKALADAGCSWDDIDAIAVTHAPGLLGSLLIGTLTARTLAILHDKPLYAVHHLKSHVYANWLVETRVLTEPIFSDARLEFSSTSYAGRPGKTAPRGSFLGAVRNIRVENSNHVMHPKKQVSATRVPTFPLLALVVSGGHTQILYMPGHNRFEIVGTTRDDAVGECFDKVAKILGLPYPGGPAIAAATEGHPILLGHAQGRSAKPTVLERQDDLQPGNPNRYPLPHPKIYGLDFSFSGLKTAVLRAVQKEVGVPISYPSHKLKELLSEQQVCDFAASFQKTAVDILVEKLKKAMEQFPDTKSIVVAGGVSANKTLRDALSNAYFPAPSLSGDNGAMVAAACYYEIQSGVKPVDPYKLNIYPRIDIAQH
ncbi:tRNA (adenosine(37)-N6)-threonylcarbamoyltransferase complex transferase subunit TsaD [Candidatus Saccharibacteria bacterium]|nr:tRNA (adenosine(37)-N6)-threonylcarbamoyltransferase complex transferase subunit TsaD [Candidatus Saccharibacteria bacterium]